MRYYAFNLPFGITIDVELGGITRPRNGRHVDTRREPGAFELWLGSRGQFYILLERRNWRSPVVGGTSS